jgi:hypothetical protein
VGTPHKKIYSEWSRSKWRRSAWSI